MWLPPSALKPHPKNPRKHGPEVLRLARHIVRTTWGRTIIQQRSTGYILAGHGAWQAAQEILAGIEVDGDLRGGPAHKFRPDAPEPGVIPVSVVDVDDVTAERIMLGDNSRAIQGKDDPTALYELAAGLGPDTDAMLDLGFGQDELDALADKATGGDLELEEVDSTDLVGARFWLSVEGPLPAQPDALAVLKRALEQIPGVTVAIVT